MSNRLTLVHHNGWRGYLYYALFPLDLFGPDTDERLAYQQAKVEELVPVHGWLVPLLVLGSAATSLGFFGMITFMSLEAFILAVLAKFHLRLQMNNVIEVWLNTWLAMTGMAIAMALFAWVFGGLADPTITWD